MNKQQKRIYKRYLDSSLYTLRQCYANYSYAKERALMECYEYMKADKGYDLRIIGYNSCFFSVGYRYKENEKTYFRFITRYSISHWEVK